MRSSIRASPNTLESRAREAGAPSVGRGDLESRPAGDPGPKLPLTRSAPLVPRRITSAFPLAAGDRAGPGGGAARGLVGRAGKYRPRARETRRRARDAAAVGRGLGSPAGRSSLGSPMRARSGQADRSRRAPTRPDETRSPTVPAVLGRRGRREVYSRVSENQGSQPLHTLARAPRLEAQELGFKTRFSRSRVRRRVCLAALPCPF